MIYARKFKAVWSNGVEKVMYATCYADYTNKVEEINKWCDSKSFKHPEIIVLKYERERMDFPNQKQVDRRFWRKS